MASRTKAEIMEGIDCDKSKLIANNTVEYWQGEKRVIRLHLTDIITFHPNKDITLNSGGWQTVTTKARMNEFLSNGWGILQENSVWYLVPNNEFGYPWAKKDTWIPFADGITIHADGAVTGQGEDPKAKLKLKRQIQKYCKGYMDQLFKGNVPKPDNGDCWHCLMVTEDNQTLGEKTKSDHLLSHIEEKYYVPSLLHRAVEVIPVSKAAKQILGFLWGFHDQNTEYWHDLAREQMQKSLRRYMYQQLGLAR